MSNYNQDRSGWQYFGLLVLTAWLSIMTNHSHAADQTIQLSANQCSVTMSANANCDAGQCAGDSACVCASKGDHVTWQLAGSDNFKLKFKGDSPLKDNCGKNFKASKHKCKVKEQVSKGQSYTYEIYLQRCTNGSDPRIVIK
jgi:hypothetical protein